jgi:hypothetical protein
MILNLKAAAMVVGCALSVQSVAFAADSAPRPEKSGESTPISLADLPDAPSLVAQAQTPPPAQSPATENSSKSQQTTPQQPKGAAAAEVQPSTGTAVSTPSGAAIAPAKQKRSRSLLIRMGALAGAAVAIGTVVALSSGSPSKPPGAN